MAEGNAGNQDKIVCRFYLHAQCREGDSCPFIHSLHGEPDRVCRFFMKGKCIYDDKCRNEHINISSGPRQRGNYRNEKQRGESSNWRAGNPCSDRRSENTSNRSKMNILNHDFNKHAATNKTHTGPGSTSWVNAPEFIPKSRRTYADIVKYNTEPDQFKFPFPELCPYSVTGICPYGLQCDFLHGDICEICGKACLHPMDKEQRKAHIELCDKLFVQNMEWSFAVQRSMGKTCGICMDVIMDKEPSSARRFGILEKCNHVFCLECIQKWRQAKQFENVLDPVVTRSCPECRVTSDFVTPSQYWYETEEEKIKLIEKYKEAMSKKPCKYFKQGEGNCPFGGACFYLHAKPDGTKVDLPLPTRRRRQNQDGEMDIVTSVFMWDYLESHNVMQEVMYEIEDIILSWTDSEEEDSVDSEPFSLS